MKIKNFRPGATVWYNGSRYTILYVHYSRPDLYLVLEGLEDRVREDHVIADYVDI